MKQMLLCMLILCACMSKTDVSNSNDLSSPVAEEREQIGKTILAIFAHPDDETVMGPLLAKWSIDHEVYLAIVTDGRYGFTDHYPHTGEEALVSVRKEEAKCSCKALGIHPPIFINLKDGLGGVEGMGAIFSQLNDMEEAIGSLISELKPRVIVTFGPGGDSGHPDHRLVGGITTQSLLERADAKETRLLFFEWSLEQADRFPNWGLNHAAIENMNAHFTFSEAEELKSFDAIRCYKSQYTESEMEDWIQIEKDDTADVLYFRDLNLSSSISTHL